MTDCDKGRERIEVARRIGILGLCVLAAAMLVGCAADLPAYPAMTDEEALRTIADRQASISTISGECELVLTSADGRTVHLDGVLVVQNPGKARLRAWKFGQAVFDLTFVDGAAWLLAPSREPASSAGATSEIPATGIREALDLLGPAFFRDARPVRSKASFLIVRGRALGRDDTLCEIDRRTLTARRFVVPGQSGGVPSEIALDRYLMVNKVPWARSIRMHGPAGEVIIRVGDVELNGELPPGAFAPAQGATRLP